MDKHISLLLFVSINVLVLCDPSEVPKITRVTAIDPLSWIVEWSPVTSLGSEDVSGYKVYIWELKDKEATVHKIVNGEPVSHTLVKPQHFAARPIEEAEQFTVIGSMNTAFIYSTATKDSFYQIMVQAFSPRWNGPLSNNLGIKFS